MQSATLQKKVTRFSEERFRRVVGRFVGKDNGPTLIVVGSIHGNEPSGRKAIEKVAAVIKDKDIPLQGRVFLLTGNIAASEHSVRFIDADLNRRWTRSNILRNTAAAAAPFRQSEDSEQRELLKIFHYILTTARDEVYVLDLHSTSADGVPFATVGDTMRNRRFAMSFPVHIILGIEEQLEGTMLEFLNNEGAVTLGFEGGQHAAARSIANHEALIFAALVNAGIVRKEDMPDHDRILARLRRVTGEPRILEVRHREAVSASDEFRMHPGFQNFDPVRRGQPLATNRHGEIVSPETAMIMMPLYQKLGEDGFFIVRPVARFWLRLSALLRTIDLARFMTLLPGVKAHPKHPEQLQVNTRIARFFPLQIFHLLGFRRLRWKRNFLIVSRRRFDTKGPFVRPEVRRG